MNVTWPRSCCQGYGVSWSHSRANERDSYTRSVTACLTVAARTALFCETHYTSLPEMYQLLCSRYCSRHSHVVNSVKYLSWDITSELLFFNMFTDCWHSCNDVGNVYLCGRCCCWNSHNISTLHKENYDNWLSEILKDCCRFWKLKP